MRTRTEHLAWCKKRAMEYVDTGDNQQAFASMCSDLMKHPETEHHASTNQIGMQMLMSGLLESREQMTKWIQGYR